jgi:hypothetical protein
VTTWQPIETAPRDGTRVLASVGVGPAAWRTIASYSDILKCWCGEGLVFNRPTHWMPLPPPPNEGE